MEQLELIRKIDFFSRLDTKIAQRVAEACIPKGYAAGDYVIRQGETGLGLFFVVSGKLRVEIERDGKRTLLAELKEQDFVGELAVIDNQPRSANVICVEDTRCLVLTRDSFLKLMDRYPQIAVQMAKSLTERLRHADQSLAEQGLSGKLAAKTGPESASGPASGVGTPPPETPSEMGPGNAAANGENGGLSKKRVQDFLLGTFSRFYTMKAMTRFSVALVGCPVRVRAENPTTDVYQVRLGEVKLLIFPNSRSQVIGVEAEAEGRFSATILRPTSGRDSFDRSHFQTDVKRQERFRIHIPPLNGEPPCLLRSNPIPVAGGEPVSGG